MTDNQLNLLAAAFARSNMGLPMENFFRRSEGYVSLEEAVYDVCGGFMEADEHEEIFIEEAKMWLSILRDESQLQAYRKSSPHVFAACGV